MTFKAPDSFRAKNVADNLVVLPSEISIKTSFIHRARYSWVTIVVGLIALMGILATVGIALGAFVFNRSTTSSTLTTTSTTSSTTTSATMCFTMPSSRPSNVWLYVGNMSSARLYHTSTLISQDGSILLTGGYNGITTVSSVDKYIPSTSCFTPMRNLLRARYGHTADQLPSLAGYVLITGGYEWSSATGLSIADLYHPITNDIITIPLTSVRYMHTSTLMSSSQVVLIGGYISTLAAAISSDMINTGLNSSFVSGTNTMTEMHVYHTATLLGNTSDLVLVTGGVFGLSYVSAAYLFHGSANAFIPLGSGVTMSPARAYHTATYLPSPINKVLIVGGKDVSFIYGTINLFDVTSLTFSTLTNGLIRSRFGHTATLLPNGKVLITGGINGLPVAMSELIDPSNNYTVTAAGNLTTGRFFHSATFIPDIYNGTVFVCGGYNAASVILNTCELYFV